MRLNAAVFGWVFFMGMTALSRMNDWLAEEEIFRYISLIYLVGVLHYWLEEKEF